MDQTFEAKSPEVASRPARLRLEGRMPLANHLERAAPLLVLALLIALPWLLHALQADYYIGFVRRVLIMSIAAMSLNLLVGYGGMVSLGHAGFMGVGAYTVAAMTQAGYSSGWLLLASSLVVSAAAAAVIGGIVLRTRGIYFIMVTIAFAQLLYYLAVALRIFGSEDGYNLPQPVQFRITSSADDAGFYWVVLFLSICCFVGLSRVLSSRFGAALSAAKMNEARTRALGFSVPQIRMMAFVLAGAIGGLAGALLSFHNGFVTPAMMHWTQSANLVVMLVLGGLGYRWGGLVGVLAWLLLEEVLRQVTVHWHWPLGLILIAMVLLAPGGLCSLPLRWSRR